jgi:pimeloyl-ACP methyl ester carboxylesterase
MDSPLPLEVNYDEESNDNLLQAFNRLLEDCAADVDCNAAFPDLSFRFYRFLEAKTKDPLVLQVAHPEQNRLETFYLQGKDLIYLLGTESTDEIPDVPLQIEKALAGDWSAIKTKLQDLLRGPADGAGRGMRLSVWCAEEAPFASPGKILEETNKYPAIKGLYPAVFSPEVCEIWGVSPLNKQENRAIISDIPTLLISGEYDNATPPKWAAQMQANLKNSYHIVFKGWQHTPTTYWANPCAMAVARAFFNHPEARPDLDCLQDIKQPKFKTK